jgi:hypothetical protein
MWWSNPKKKFISRHVLHEHWYTCPTALPVRRNPQHRSLFDSCLSHFRISVSTSSSAKHLPPSCEPVYATNTSHRKQDTFLHEYPSHWVLLFTKTRTTEHCSSVLYPQVRSPFWLLKPVSEHAHARLLPRLSWSWTVLLPSDTHRQYTG